MWTIGSNGTLYGLNPSSGATQEQVTIGAPANHFPTPSVGAGLLLAPAANRVVAFGMASAAASGEDHDHRELDDDIHDGGPRATERDRSRVVAAAIVGGLAVLGLLTWLRGRVVITGNSANWARVVIAEEVDVVSGPVVGG